MIPKIIHYCWFGEKKPVKVAKYIEEWKNICSDYQIIEWNEKNFNLENSRFAQDALKEKKWAFVSDYIRYHVLYQYGGIYLDTDVEVLRNFDDLLQQDAFCGFEIDRVGTGIIGAKPKNAIIGHIKDIYDVACFYNEDHSLNLITSPEYMTRVMIQYGFQVKNEEQHLNSITVYPSDFFSPYNHTTFDCTITENSYTIHHYMGSWLDERAKFRVGIQYKLKKFCSNRLAYKLSMVLTLIKYEGMQGLITHIFDK